MAARLSWSPQDRDRFVGSICQVASLAEKFDVQALDVFSAMRWARCAVALGVHPDALTVQQVVTAGLASERTAYRWRSWWVERVPLTWSQLTLPCGSFVP